MPKTITIDGARVKACTGSDSLRGRQDSRAATVRCPDCSRFYLAAACQTIHGTPVIPRHRAAGVA